MASPRQPGQSSGGMFQKYTGEQINQIPEGYVEGMGSMGKAYASIGQSIGQAAQTLGQAYGAQKAADAKLQGQLAPYLKRDPRVQMVDASISAGNLVRGEDGKIGLGAGIDESMLSPDARSSIDFYNKIGGDGSALSGTDLTKFATEFETEQKIASLDSERADKAVDRELKAAKILELRSKAIKNTNTMGNAAIIGGLGSGQDIGSYNVPTQTGQQPAQGQPQAQPQGQPEAFVTPVVNRTGGQLNQPGAIDFSRFGISPVYTQDRANAGAALTTSLGQTPISASRYYTAPEVMPSAPAEQALPASASPEELKADIAMLQGQVSTFENSTNGEYNEAVAQTIQTLQGKIQAKQVMLNAATAPAKAPATGGTTPAQQGTAAAPATVTAPAGAGTAPVALPPMTQTEQQFTTEFVRSEQARLTTKFNVDAATLEADYMRRKLAITQNGATSGDIEKLTKEYTAMLDGKRKNYEANYNSVEKGIAEERAAAAAARAEEEYAFKFGRRKSTTPAPAVSTAPTTATTATATTPAATTVATETAPATAGTTATATGENPVTFTQTIADRFTGATQGRVGGTVVQDEVRKVRKEHQEIMSDHPAWWQSGMYTQGAKEYQWGLSQYPVSAGIDGTIKGKVQEEVTGYVESQNFLQVLYKNIESGSDNAIRNYLDRFLIFTSKDDSQSTAELANQFGVAAFRRAIVSGGNFSDADREYVARIITNMNSPNVFKDKKRLLVEAKALAAFIDSKFRSTLSSQNITIDPSLSRKFLEREGNSAGLATLEKTENFFKTFGINPTAKARVYNTDNETPSGWRKLAAKARAAGGKDSNKLAEGFEKQASELEAQLKASEAEARKRLGQ
jgi:hypothetical protein